MDHTTQANVLSTMLQNLEEEKKRVLRQYDAKLEIGNLAQKKISKQQALSQVDADIALLETQLSAKREEKEIIAKEIAAISSNIQELANQLITTEAAVAAGAAVVAEAGAKSGTESKADTGASATAAAAIHTPSSTDNADDAAETESEPTEAGASEDEDAEKRAGTVTTCTSRERSERGKPRACAFCRKTGHKQNTCPDAYCMRCCLMGHPADYCKNKPCIHCGKKLEKKDHYPINCPLKPTSGRGRGGRTAGRGGRGGAAGAAGAKST